VENLVSFLQAVALVVVVIAPWAPLVALFVGGVWFVGWRTVQRAVARNTGGKPTV
jgi:hypothetical protein